LANENRFSIFTAVKNTNSSLGDLNYSTGIWGMDMHSFVVMAKLRITLAKY
jgi:hypothetical protein